MAVGVVALLLGAGVALRCGNPTDATPEKVVLLTMPDTAVVAGNSLCLYALSRAPRRDTVAQYHWSSAQGRGIDTTTSTGLLCRQWMVEDSGVNAVVVQALTRSGRELAIDTILVTVNVCFPSIDTVTADSIAWVGDTSEFRVVRGDSCTAAARYVWTFDDRLSHFDTTVVPVVRRVWALGDTGSISAAVRLIDAAGLASNEQRACTRVRYCRPVVMLTVDSTMLVPDSLHASARLVTCADDVAFFVWSLGAAAPETTLVGECAWPRATLADTGTMVVHVYAVDVFGGVSAQVRDTTQVIWCTPDLALTGDTLFSVGDTALFEVFGRFCADDIVAYVWTFENAHDSTDQTRYVKRWALADTGRQTVTVRALTGLGIYSAPESLSVTVAPQNPQVVRLGGGTHFQLGDTAIFTAVVTPSSVGVNRYEWTISGASTTRDTTAAGIQLRQWSLADTGNVVVRVTAVDADGQRSMPDSLIVRVGYCRPRLHLVGDTIAYVNDTMTMVARDSAGCAADLRFYWAVGSALVFRDTTRDASLWMRWTEADTGAVTIRATARDQYGMEALGDSATIRVLVGGPVIELPESASVVINDTLAVQAALIRSTHAISRYVWAVDGQSFDRTTTGGLIRLVWPPTARGRHVVHVKAVDSRGVESAPDSTVVTVRLEAPWVERMHDTLVSCADSVRLLIRAHDSSGAIDMYFWSVNGFAWTDSSSDSMRTVAWNGADTVRVVYGARDTDGLMATDSMHIYFSPPVIDSVTVTLVPHDTNVTVNDSIVLVAGVRPGGSSIARFAWAVDDGAFDIMTIAGRFGFAWPAAAHGRHVVRVKAIDAYGAMTDADSAIVHVWLDAPRVAAMRDTLVSWTDPVRLTIRARDSSGSIEKYLWSVNSFAWTDSSVDSAHTVTWTGRDTVRVVYGARDNHGLIALDSMHVYFNRPPTGLRMVRPINNDTIVFGLCDGTYGQGAVAFSFWAQDPNGALDSLTYSLRIGISPAVLNSAYRGRADSVRIAGLDTATYHWRLAAHDLYGDSSALSGSFTTLLRKTICFIGHSIVNGSGGDLGTGGFRKGVIDGLRARSGSLARVQPVGPLTVGMLSPESDDSCLAYDAAIAMSMSELFVNSYPDLLADAYVIMLGVNWQYSASEFGYILGMVDDMHRRTPNSAIYWVNGLPYPQTYWIANHIRVKNFNRWVADTVASRQAQGWNIHLIDGFNALCIDTLRADTVGVVDTVRVDSLFNDDLHPNQRGYDALSRLLLDSISVRW